MGKISKRLKEKAGKAKNRLQGWAEKTQADVQEKLNQVTAELNETSTLLEEKSHLLKQIAGNILTRVEEIRGTEWWKKAIEQMDLSVKVTAPKIQIKKKKKSKAGAPKAKTAAKKTSKKGGKA